MILFLSAVMEKSICISTTMAAHKKKWNSTHRRKHNISLTASAGSAPMSDQPSRFPVVYKNEWMVQVWKDKNTCFFAYFKRPPNCKDMHGHIIHAAYEIA